jgi:hypothetical protein
METEKELKEVNEENENEMPVDKDYSHPQKKNLFISILWRLNFAAYCMEFVGTFMLTLIVALTAQSINQPLAIGASLTTLVFLGGHVSGGHFNPGNLKINKRSLIFNIFTSRFNINRSFLLFCSTIFRGFNRIFLRIHDFPRKLKLFRTSFWSRGKNLSSFLC